MRTNPFKRALTEGRVTFGTWVTMGDPWATRVLARAGFDWLTIDLEHAPIDWARAADLFGFAAEAGCVPLARVPSGTHGEVKRALDSGAWGVIVPMVDTPEQAAAAVAAAKYPPVGNRSTGGGLHALAFDASAADYYANANDEIVVVVQTESPAGVSQLAEICAVPGVDAVFIGPNDLRRFMYDEQGAPTTERFEATLAQIRSVTEAAGMPCGILTFDATQARERVGQGMTMIGVSTDVLMLTARADALVADLAALRP